MCEVIPTKPAVRSSFKPTPLQAHVFFFFVEKNQKVYIIDDIETGKSFVDEICS